MKRKTARRATIAVVAVVMASSLLSGTYAWQMLRSSVPNANINLKNPGGRLHDDFNGLNTTVLSTQGNDTQNKVKNVYVENFTEAGKGEDIYARIRLYEYLEIGTGAGKADGTKGKYAKSLLEKDEDNDGENDITFDDADSWTIHKWDSQASQISDYIALSTGGSTVYLPTYNMDQDNIHSEVNGTLAGSDGNILTLKDAYDDYQVYEVGDTAPGVEVWAADEDGQDEIDNAGITAQDLIDAVLDENGAVRSEIDENATTLTLKNGTAFDITKVVTDSSGAVSAIYLDLTEDDVENSQIKLVVTQPHEAKKTLTTEAFLSMESWINDYNSLAGPYWVYDTDGWVYWASPIEPGTATGCLINGIYTAKEKMPSEYYYGLNVVAQFATKDDWKDADEGFGADGTITEDGLALLDAISNTATNGYGAALTMNVEDDQVLLGGDIQFMASFTDSGTGNAITSGITWNVGSVDGAAETAMSVSEAADVTSISETGLLHIAADETRTSLKITASCTDSQGKLWKAIKVLTDFKASYYRAELTRTDSITTVMQDTTLAYALTVEKVTADGAQALTPDAVTWKVDESSSATNATTITANDSEKTKATLQIAADEMSENLKVTAEYTVDGSTHLAEAEAVAVRNRTYAIALTSEESGNMEVGTTRQYQATVTTPTGIGEETEEVTGAKLTWKVEGNESANTKITQDGLLTISEDETATPVNVKVSFTDAINEEAYEAETAVLANVTVSIKGEEVGASTAQTLTIDGLEWYVMAVKDGKALLWLRDVLRDENAQVMKMAYDDTSSSWKDSDIRAYLNGTDSGQFLEQYPTIAAIAEATKIKTRKYYDRDDKYIESTDKVFLLTEADVCGTANKGSAQPEDYTAGVPLLDSDEKRNIGARYWLRSPMQENNYVAVIGGAGALFADGVPGTTTGVHCVRPAFWMDLSSTVVYELSVATEDPITSAQPGGMINYTAVLTKYEGLTGTTLENPDVQWSIEGNESSHTMIENGKLMIASDETAYVIKVQASYTKNGLTTRTETKVYPKVVTVEGKQIGVASTDTVTIDGIDWYVMTEKDGKVLLWAKEAIRDGDDIVQMAFGSSRFWNGSNVETYLNGKNGGQFLATHSRIASVAEKVTIKVRNAISDAKFYETEDQVFLLTETDLFGTLSGSTENVVADDYTFGEQLVVDRTHLLSDSWTWLRSQNSMWNHIQRLTSTGEMMPNYINGREGMRPAFWYDLSNSAE